MEGWRKYVPVAKLGTWAKNLFAAMYEKRRLARTPSDGAQRKPSLPTVARKAPPDTAGHGSVKDDFSLPEGLRRPRMGPLNRHTGRRPTTDPNR